MSRERAFAAILVVLVIATIGLLPEALLRLAGRTPWAPLAESNEPLMLQPDPLLGWRNRPGSYRYPPYTPTGGEIRVTIHEDGRRAAEPAELAPGAARYDGRDQLVFLGGSLVFGWAVSDDETLPWQLQTRLPALKVLNYGAGGYGTYQSLLNLERLIPELESARLVVYGLYDGHEVRNVAAASWLSVLAWASHRGHVELPFATLDGDALVRHPPARYVRLPLRERLASAVFFERLYNELLDGVGPADRSRSRRRVTGAILRELKRTCERHALSLVVVTLRASEGRRRHYARQLAAIGVPAVDCAIAMRPELQVEGEGHPTGAVHRRWSECLAQGLAARGLPGAAR